MRLFSWGTRVTRGEIARRWPALAEDAAADLAVIAALDDLRARQDPDDARNDFLAAEPLLQRIMQRGDPTVRRAALDTWVTLLEGRVKRQHVDVLFDLSSEPDLHPELLQGILRAALTFGDDEGEMAQELLSNAQSTRRNQHLR